MNINLTSLTRGAFFFALVLFATSCENEKKNDTPWKNLFNGESLEGWNQMGGDANYGVKDNAIVGSTVHNSPNTFLTTNKMYDNFILEVDFRVDSTINSGIQIRSNSLPHYQDGRVHGYQVEIDPSERAYSAGIYDEARRGWLHTLENNPEARKAFKQNEWNSYRIEAIGDTIKTWINDVPASYLIDDKTNSGFIALQVHSIGENDQEGKEVMWKDIRILTDSLSKYSRQSPLEPINTKNRLSLKERDNGWKLLWDGKTTLGWRGARLDEFPEQGWEIENGELVVLASGGEESVAGGDIVTKELYSDFELKIDFKITEGANSGIKYYVDTDLNKGPGSSIGLEYQILDDKRHPDAKLGNHEGSRTLASLYDLIQADPDKPVNPIGEWNTARIVSRGNHVEHWLNGVKVLEYDRKSEDFKKLVSESKYDKWPNFGEAEKGHILLQDHGNRVAFRNIKVKQL
ncbi:3-keto-disaccharide hydrolase [Autumnicola psychrophila]|uniref:DUF1080 domain-containing protein n=1 Tax=Autumnicola psychrophila TaxID=3075592 RepID=A0ABU3DWF2_9FLAO|nr:DUF1080 domain-containing protein [Zunongwangia sp. F225]MDT0688054.1 DUF1080 domain-containing protein [Zunongwangia sp. F225]